MQCYLVFLSSPCRYRDGRPPHFVFIVLISYGKVRYVALWLHLGVLCFN